MNKIFAEISKGKDKIYASIRKAFDEHPVIKFAITILVILVYFAFAAHSHGLKNGAIISILTWSFFVLCTPIADGGILIDFPMRLITGIKMIYSEIIVWVVAIGVNIGVHLIDQSIYEKTILLSLFKHILDAPFPYWTIIILSGLGTFLSLYIADDLVDSHKHRKKHISFIVKHKLIIFAFIILLIIIVYDFLLNKLGVHIPLL
jgi:hypothetical protein